MQQTFFIESGEYDDMAALQRLWLDIVWPKTCDRQWNQKVGDGRMKLEAIRRPYYWVDIRYSDVSDESMINRYYHFDRKTSDGILPLSPRARRNFAVPTSGS